MSQYLSVVKLRLGTKTKEQKSVYVLFPFILLKVTYEIWRLPKALLFLGSHLFFTHYTQLNCIFPTKQQQPKVTEPSQRWGEQEAGYGTGLPKLIWYILLLSKAAKKLFHMRSKCLYHKWSQLYIFFFLTIFHYNWRLVGDWLSFNFWWNMFFLIW